MKLGRIIGRVVSTIKVESFDGLKLLLVQPLDEKLEKAGDPIVAVDMIQSGIGELIYFETSKEAGRVLETTMNPCDAAIMGIVDEVSVEKIASRKL
ncbi:MAG TPA: ethanolamine utilization protein EutN [Bacteroidales bacterium]|nr:MAG: ethanolamine utilization protein EutN [Bacteroidetes bacterium GWF2_33_38]OFY76633.1 MAG: ethanolamine utilization protein EutN [Bacteroidetes bacterium RIFOXYA12_FULL_33_9]OFY92391.1 MAG: ethanolamine utilization protein EutN [Bacteroidetes bacterium RIFOXYA2_FULL_33_7]HBF88553.1 ethanolamine utilization protein EutN [Bacteroidales bacterium]